MADGVDNRTGAPATSSAPGFEGRMRTLRWLTRRLVTSTICSILLFLGSLILYKSVTHAALPGISLYAYFVVLTIPLCEQFLLGGLIPLLGVMTPVATLCAPRARWSPHECDPSGQDDMSRSAAISSLALLIIPAFLAFPLVAHRSSLPVPHPGQSHRKHPVHGSGNRSRQAIALSCERVEICNRRDSVGD
jgi:hypothetical protein